MKRYRKILLTAGVMAMVGGFTGMGAAAQGAVFACAYEKAAVTEPGDLCDTEAALQMKESRVMQQDSESRAQEENSQEIWIYFDEQNETPVYQTTFLPKEELPVPVYTGYQFVGWNKSADGGGEYVSEAAQLGDTDRLYAIWEKFPDGVLAKRKKMLLGETTRLVLKKATGKLTWSSSDPKVLAVDPKGNVTAKKLGTAVITVKQYEKEYHCRITVKKPNWKQAYEIVLSQMENPKKASYLLRNMDGKKEPELIVVDQLPVTLKENKKSTGTATYYDIGKEDTKKTVSIYTYRKGKAVLLKKLKYKKNLNIMASRRSSGLMIMDMREGKTTYQFINMKNGKITATTAATYRGSTYKIAVVTRGGKGLPRSGK